MPRTPTRPRPTLPRRHVPAADPRPKPEPSHLTRTAGRRHVEALQQVRGGSEWEMAIDFAP